MRTAQAGVKIMDITETPITYGTDDGLHELYACFELFVPAFARWHFY